MSKLTPEEFREYLKTVRALAEGPFEEMQKEVEVTNKFPQESTTWPSRTTCTATRCPRRYGDGACPRRRSCRWQEDVLPAGPGGMRMHLHYAADLNWRILDDYGKPELKAEFMDKFQDKTIFTNFALTEQTGGTGAICIPPRSRTRTATTCSTARSGSSPTPTARSTPTSSR